MKFDGKVGKIKLSMKHLAVIVIVSSCRFSFEGILKHSEFHRKALLFRVPNEFA